MYKTQRRQIAVEMNVKIMWTSNGLYMSISIISAWSMRQHASNAYAHRETNWLDLLSDVPSVF